MKRALYKSSTGLLALLLSGCLIWGNGEGIGRKPTNTAPGLTSDGVYYDLDPAAVCTSAEGESLYQWQIEVHGSTVIRTDRCTGGKTTLDASAVRFSRRWTILTHDGAIYELRNSAPAVGDPYTSYAQAFCTGGAGEALVANGPGLSVPYGYVWWQSRFRQGDLSVSNGGSIHELDATDFRIRIDTTTAGTGSGEFAGTLDLKDGSEAAPLSCAYRP